MQKQGIEIRSIFGRTPQLLVFLFITALICGLLVTNYLSQRSLQQANIYRFQQNFQKSTASVSYFFSERENDITNMANSKPVTGFFSNQKLGMSMTYGLRLSLNSVTQLFKHRTVSARMGEEYIYSHLSLLDVDGKILSRWPVDETDEYHRLPEAVGAQAVTVTSESFGCLTFIAPVFLHDRLQGYIQGEVSFDTLTNYLLGDTSGLLFITLDGRLVFQSQPETTILPSALERIDRTDNIWPLELNRTDFVDSPTARYTQNTPFTLFSSTIPKYKLNLYLAEESSTISRRQSPLLLMVVLGVLSAGVLFGSVTILRTNTKNIILETSLFEAGRREKAVAEKMEELELIIDGARLGTWNWDITSGQVLFNERWMAMLGYAMGELDTHIDTYTNLVHPDDLEAVRQNLRAHFKGETAVYSVEHRLRHKSGKWIWVLDASKVLKRDETGRPLRALGIQLNLTEQKEAQQLLDKLKKSLNVTVADDFFLTHNDLTAYLQYNATPIASPDGIEHVVSLRDITGRRKADAARVLLATVIEQLADAVIITKTDGVIQYVNPAAIHTSGYSQSELLGRKTSILKSNQIDPAIFKEIWQTITQGHVWSGRLKSAKKDNSSIEEEVTISPVRNEEGDITHYVAIKRDVTKIDLLQKQLLKAQKMETIGQLAAGIAHEINTPMQYVQNNVTFLGRVFEDISVLVRDYRRLLQTPGIQLSDEAEKHLAVIDLDFLMEEIPQSVCETHGGINRVVKIVSALKEFSHPGSHAKTLIDVNHIIESTITVSRNEWKYVAEIVTDFDPELPLVSCQPDQLSQALLNLIVNSAQAIAETGATVPDNPGRIGISTRHSGNFAEIRVSDSGGGIPEEIHNRIFDPFFTTKEVGKGTGQGLSIAHAAIVQKNGGSIDFVSEPGKGTTFILRLPFKTIDNNKGQV